MNLRKTIKARTFYDDRDFRDPHQDEVYRALPIPTRQPAFRGQVIDYNPRLRPAAFPTIPLGQVVAQTGEEVTIHTVSESKAIPFTRPEVTVAANASSSALELPISQSQNALQAADAFQGQPGDTEFPLNVSNMFTYIDQKEWSRRLSPARSPSLERQISVSDKGNPVYTKNMELMERLSKRTDEEWAEAEMATSDEEDEDEEPRGRQMNDHSAPAWDDLPVNVRLDLVDKVGEQDATLDATFNTLRLEPIQKYCMLDHIEAYNDYLDDEGQIITEVGEVTKSRLQTGNKRDLDYFLDSGHRRLLRKYLYNAVSGTDYQTASGEDLALAKSYLTMCGITLSLDHWVNAENHHRTKSTGNGTKPSASTTHSAQETAPRPVPSAASAFPTYPLQRAATPETPTPSDPRVAPQPVKGVSKPTGLLRAPPRRGSIFKQGNPNPSSQASAEPTTTLELNVVPKPLHGTRIVEAPAGDQLPQPLARGPYVQPFQALPFSLPPQLSNYRQEWLPDGRPPHLAVNNTTSQPAVMVPNMINHTPTCHGGPQIVRGPQDTMPGRVQDTLPFSNPQLYPNPFPAQAQYDYNGNLTCSMPAFTPDTHAPFDSYEQSRMQFSHRDPPPPPSIEASRLNNNVSMPPPPLAPWIGLSSQLYSSIPSQLQNPYAMTYHTVDYGAARDVPVTAGKTWQSGSAQPAPATSIYSENEIYQGQGFTEPLHPALPTPTGDPTSAGVTPGQSSAPTEEDRDDDYVPVKKGRVRKAPAKASKKRKTTA